MSDLEELQQRIANLESVAELLANAVLRVHYGKDLHDERALRRAAEGNMAIAANIYEESKR